MACFIVIKIPSGIFLKKKHLSLKGNLCQESTPCSWILWHSCLRHITVDLNFIKHNVYIMIAALQEGCIPISYHKCIFCLYWTFCYILVYHKKVQSFQRYLISYYFVSGLSLFFFFSTETSIPKNIQKFKVFFLQMIWKISVF